MDKRRFSLEEFEALFPHRFATREELRREYESFLAVFAHLDRAVVPELSSSEKAAIFRNSWRRSATEPSRPRVGLACLRRPAVAFAAGIVLGAALMLTAVSGWRVRPQPLVAEQPLTIERTGHTQTYKGKVIGELYPQIENPRLVLERTAPSSTPQRVLYGTVDGGEIYVVWNL